MSIKLRRSDRIVMAARCDGRSTPAQSPIFERRVADYAFG
jgi:hypothetical protein